MAVVLDFIQYLQQIVKEKQEGMICDLERAATAFNFHLSLCHMICFRNSLKIEKISHS